MAVQYLRHWEDREHVSPPASKTKLREDLPRVLSSRGGGPYDIKVIKDGERDPDFSVKRPRAETVDRVFDLLTPTSPLDVGDRVRIRDAEGNVLRIIIVEAAPKVDLPPTSDRWHPLLRDLYVEVYGQRWEGGRPSFMGAEHCRANTRDPSLWSMHSFWGPVLAMDIGVASLPLGDEINRFIESKPDFNELIVVWREPLHFNHLHAQVGHNRSGAPSCA